MSTELTRDFPRLCLYFVYLLMKYWLSQAHCWQFPSPSPFFFFFFFSKEPLKFHFVYNWEILRYNVSLFILFWVCKQASHEKGILSTVSRLQWSAFKATGVKATVHGSVQNSTESTFHQLRSWVNLLISAEFPQKDSTLTFFSFVLPVWIFLSIFWYYPAHEKAHST